MDAEGDVEGVAFILDPTAIQTRNGFPGLGVELELVLWRVVCWIVIYSCTPYVNSPSGFSNTKRI